MDMEFQVGQSVTFGFDLGGSYVPPEPEPEIPQEPYLYTDSAPAVTIGEAEDVKPWDFWDIWSSNEEDAKSTATINVTPSMNCLLMVAVMHRETVTIAGDGWTKVVTSQPALDNGAGVQWITVWTKNVPAGSYSVTVNQSQRARMGLKVIAFYSDNVSVSIAEDHAIAAFPYTPTAKTGKRRLYLLSSVWTTSESTAIQATSYGNLDLQLSYGVRFTMCWDYLPEIAITPTFTYVSSYNTNSANSLVLDIDCPI
jgi:hypothetical protein